MSLGKDERGEARAASRRGQDEHAGAGAANRRNDDNRGRAGTASEAVIEIRDVWHSFRDTPVLEGVDFALQRNDYAAILGPNGSGKTTLLRIILGLVRPQRGAVAVLGTTPDRAHGRIGYVPQHFQFDAEFPLSVFNLVMMGRLSRRGLLRRFTRHDRDVAREMLERVELHDLAERPIRTLSGGQLQRALIARALALEPELLLLDEPTASLDERSGRSVWELLEELSRDMTVLLVSHDVGAISQYVRSVCCLNRRLHCHPTGALTREILEATYGCPVDLLAHGQPHRVLDEHAHIAAATLGKEEKGS
jgi:zinc transport system ATP-binding protein